MSEKEQWGSKITGLADSVHHSISAASFYIHEKTWSARCALKEALHAPGAGLLKTANRVAMPDLDDGESIKQWFAEVSARPDGEDIIRAALKVKPVLLRHIFPRISRSLSLKGAILEALKYDPFLDEFLIYPVTENPFAEEIYTEVARHICAPDLFVGLFDTFKDKPYADKLRKILLSRMSPQSLLYLYWDYSEGDRPDKYGTLHLKNPLSFFTDEIIREAIERAPDVARQIGLVSDAPLDL